MTAIRRLHARGRQPLGLCALALPLIGCSGSPSPPRGEAPTTPPVASSAPAAPTPGPSDPPAPATPYQPAAKTTLTELVTQNNAFAFELYRQLSEGNEGLVMSPASISLALGMTYGGAAGETADQMKETLHFTLPGDSLHDAFGTLLRQWEPKPKQPYELAVANRLFGDRGLTFNKPYLALTGDHYRAPLEPVDFVGAPESARRHINGWVSDRTEERIQNLLPEGSVTPDTRLVLTNAIYFKGSWKTAFDEKNTKPQAFHAPDGTKKVPMMHLESRFAYGETSEAQVIEMPYQGDDLAMQIVLPKKKDGVTAVEEALTTGKLDPTMSQLVFLPVKAAVPRFEIAPASPLRLAKTLAAMGMPRAFTSRAELPHIADLSPGEGLAIAEVFHKAFVEVNEEGTEAAAATGVTVFRTTALQRPVEPKRFIADRPFVFLIRDKRSGAILFMGRVSDP